MHSYASGGRHGHLALTIAPVAYLALAGVVFVPQVAPPAAPIHGEAPTAAQITEANRLHLADQRIFQRYHDVDRALLRQFIAAVPPVYIAAALNDRTFGFSNVTCLMLLQHLKEHFGCITLSEMDANTACMFTAWNPPTPFDALFAQLDDGVYFAAAGLEPLVDSHVARLGYNILLTTGLFADACCEWRLRPAPERTFVAFKADFRRMDMD